MQFYTTMYKEPKVKLKENIEQTGSSEASLDGLADEVTWISH